VKREKEKGDRERRKGESRNKGRGEEKGRERGDWSERRKRARRKADHLHTHFYKSVPMALEYMC